MEGEKTRSSTGSYQRPRARSRSLILAGPYGQNLSESSLSKQIKKNPERKKTHVISPSSPPSAVSRSPLCLSPRGAPKASQSSHSSQSSQSPQTPRSPRSPRSPLSPFAELRPKRFKIEKGKKKGRYISSPFKKKKYSEVKSPKATDKFSGELPESRFSPIQGPLSSDDSDVKKRGWTLGNSRDDFRVKTEDDQKLRDERNAISSLQATHQEKRASSRRMMSMVNDDPTKCLFHCCVVGDVLTSEWLLLERGANIQHVILPDSPMLPSNYYRVRDTPILVARRYQNYQLEGFLLDFCKRHGIEPPSPSSTDPFGSTRNHGETDTTETTFKQTLKSLSRRKKKNKSRIEKGLRRSTKDVPSSKISNPSRGPFYRRSSSDNPKQQKKEEKREGKKVNKYDVFRAEMTRLEENGRAERPRTEGKFESDVRRMDAMKHKTLISPREKGHAKPAPLRKRNQDFEAGDGKNMDSSLSLHSSHPELKSLHSIKPQPTMSPPGFTTLSPSYLAQSPTFSGLPSPPCSPDSFASFPRPQTPGLQGKFPQPPQDPPPQTQNMANLPPSITLTFNTPQDLPPPPQTPPPALPPVSPPPSLPPSLHPSQPQRFPSSQFQSQSHPQPSNQAQYPHSHSQPHFPSLSRSQSPSPPLPKPPKPQTKPPSSPYHSHVHSQIIQSQFQSQIHPFPDQFLSQPQSPIREEGGEEEKRGERKKEEEKEEEEKEIEEEKEKEERPRERDLTMSDFGAKDLEGAESKTIMAKKYSKEKKRASERFLSQMLLDKKTDEKEPLEMIDTEDGFFRVSGTLGESETELFRRLPLEEVFKEPKNIHFLIKRMTKETPFWSDLVQMFFLSFVEFSNWREVCSLLLGRWNPASKKHISQIFRHWITTYYLEDWSVFGRMDEFKQLLYDFSLPENDISTLMCLTSAECSPEDGPGYWLNDSIVGVVKREEQEKEKKKGTRVVDLRKLKLKSSEVELFPPKREKKVGEIAQNPFGDVRKLSGQQSSSSSLDEYSNWIEWDEIVISDQLALLHWNLLRSVRPRDFILWNTSKDKKKDCENLYELTQHFNRTAFWVVSEMVVRVRSTERVALLEKFISIATLSLHISNFFGAKALLTGISHPAISRMKKTFQLLSREAKARFNKLHRVIGMDNDNGAFYRSMLKTCRSPYIPFIGLHTKDLVYLFDGNISVSGTGINFHKFLMIWETVSTILKGVVQQYESKKNYEVYRFLKHPANLDEDQIFEWSRRVEPKNVEALVAEFIRNEMETSRNLTKIQLEHRAILQRASREKELLQEKLDSKDMLIGNLEERLIETLTELTKLKERKAKRDRLQKKRKEERLKEKREREKERKKERERKKEKEDEQKREIALRRTPQREEQKEDQKEYQPNQQTKEQTEEKREEEQRVSEKVLGQQEEEEEDLEDEDEDEEDEEYDPEKEAKTRENAKRVVSLVIHTPINPVIKKSSPPPSRLVLTTTMSSSSSPTLSSSPSSSLSQAPASRLLGVSPQLSSSSNSSTSLLLSNRSFHKSQSPKFESKGLGNDELLTAPFGQTQKSLTWNSLLNFRQLPSRLEKVLINEIGEAKRFEDDDDDDDDDDD